jgi:hypothetical protein
MLVNLASYRGKTVVNRSICCSLDACISLSEINEKEKKEEEFFQDIDSELKNLHNL